MPCSKPNCDCAARHVAAFGDTKIGYPCLYPGDWPPEATAKKDIATLTELLESHTGKKAIIIPGEYLTLVTDMRDLQRKFFNGDRSVVARAKKAEAAVDAATNKILSDAGWTATEWAKRPPPVQQGGLF